MILSTMERTHVNNEIAARILAVGQAACHAVTRWRRRVSFPCKTLKFTGPWLHACLGRLTAIFLPEVMQVITCFVGNTDHQIKKRESFEIRTRFHASVAVIGSQTITSIDVKISSHSMSITF